MATITADLGLGGKPRNTNSAQYYNVDGTNYPVTGYAFDAATDEDIFATFSAVGYGSGNLTVKLTWYADTATSNNCVWGAAIAAITASTDTQNIETDGLGTAATATDAAGANAQSLQEASITVSSLDSLAAGDFVTLRVYRDANNASDTMAGDAILTQIVIEYSDS